jgi:hypothetical protein
VVKKGFFLGWLYPERQRVVAKMIVQVDESGNDKGIARIDYRSTFESGGGGPGSGNDSFDEAIIS